MLKNILHFLLPNCCLLCHNSCCNNLCQECIDDLPYLRQACHICAQPLTVDSICAQCQQQLPEYHRCICVTHYQHPINYIIQQFKFHQNLAAGYACSQLLLKKIQDYYRLYPLPEVIIPIPLAKKRLRQRGFNQALELAKPIAKKLQMKIDYTSCQRIRDTAAQTELIAKQRKANVTKAFAMYNKKHYTHVALIDDVMTTGHTVNECSRSLRQSGVEKIDVWCIARASHVTKLQHHK